MLLKGATSILKLTEIVRHGPLSPFFVPYGSEPSDAVRSVVKQFEHLERHMQQAAVDAAICATIKTEMDSLVHWVEHGSRNSSNAELRIALAWPTATSESFLVLLRQRSPPALALLAYYCSIMSMTERAFWFTRGWSVGVLNDISQSLGRPWDEAVRWSREFVSNQL